MCEVLHKAETTQHIWLYLIGKYQVKSKIDVSRLKTAWINRRCADAKVNLWLWLEEDKRIVKEIEDVGGVVTDDEKRSHILTQIPEYFRCYIASQMSMFTRATGKVMDTDEMVDDLTNHYLYLHPELPDWVAQSGIPVGKPKPRVTDTPKVKSPETKPPKNVALQVEGSSKPSDTKSDSDFSCYNCRGTGHIAHKCPSPKQNRSRKDSGKGKSHDNKGGWKGKGKETPKEAPKVDQPVLKLGQANTVNKEVTYAYMAEPDSDMDLSGLSSDELGDSEDCNSNVPALQAVSDSEDGDD
ncbi:hypothetical protein VKT23_019026 [Stygiomarasmius scandens]|uniref:CCHC-type domain-containing protein n=1 Tax=Marasmiellus scandens TaxID=2682957 RepID=A0ABR1IMG8_9AGAR